MAAGLTHGRHQTNNPLFQPDIRDIRTLGVATMRSTQTPRQVWKHLMPWVCFTGVRHLVNRAQPHGARQAPNAFPINPAPQASQMRRHAMSLRHIARPMAPYEADSLRFLASPDNATPGG